MTITYTLGIPAANNNPSQDQPNMQQNTNAISQLISVDHVTFSGDPAGFHNHVSFPGPQLDPVVGTGQSQIYPKSFGSSTTYLETYYEFTDSTAAVHYAYLPIVKAMVRFTGVPAMVAPQTLTLPANTLQVNIASVVQTNLNPGDGTVITINFTNPLPYTTYFVFFDYSEISLSAALTVTKNTTSIVLTNGGFPFNGATVGLMVI